MLSSLLRQPDASPWGVSQVRWRGRHLLFHEFLRYVFPRPACCLRFAAGAEPMPVPVYPVMAKRGVVVAGHPQAAEAGLAVLKAGGNAIDAAIATSLALGVAEPYASGLGGKLMLLYYEAASGQIYVVEAMDAAPSIDVAATCGVPRKIAATVTARRACRDWRPGCGPPIRNGACARGPTMSNRPSRWRGRISVPAQVPRSVRGANQETSPG